MDNIEVKKNKANNRIPVCLMDRNGNTINCFSIRNAAKTIGVTELTISRLLKTGKYGYKGYCVISLSPFKAIAK